MKHMNKYCDTSKLYKEYSLFNKLLLSFELSEAENNNNKEEIDEVKNEIRIVHGDPFKNPVVLTDEFKKWHKNVGYNYTFQNKFERIMVIRNFVQGWLDDVRTNMRMYKSDGSLKKSWVDNVEFFFRGCYKQRKNYLFAFASIANELAGRLDALDGGCDNNLKQQDEFKKVNKHKVGFGL